MKTSGSCPCGGVTFSVNGDAILQFFCHCNSCQRAHCAPLVAVALFPVGAVSIQGETGNISITNRDFAARRIYCVHCGTRVSVIPAGEGSDQLRGIFPALCSSTEWFRPQMHVFWQDHSVETRDALPRYVDTPKAFGGTGLLA